MCSITQVVLITFIVIDHKRLMMRKSHNLVIDRSHSTPDPKTTADSIPGQFREFQIPAKEYAQLNPANLYTMCTDTIHEIEDRVIEPTPSNSESEAK